MLTESLRRLTLAFLVLVLPSAGISQAPQSRPLTVTYTGIVTNDVTDTISIRQPDGSFARYAGPVPQYEYKKGDQVTISFNTTVPTSAYYSANNVPPSTDGIYRISVNGPIGNPSPFGNVRNFDVTGSLRPVATAFGVGGITIVYDSRADSYSLEFPTGNWAASYLAGPSYVYDAQTGAMLPSTRNCFFAGCEDGASLRGNATDVTLSSAVGNSRDTGNLGFFSLLFNGSWNLPTYSASSGGPAQVPEPGSMVLFGGAVAWLVRRQRRRHSKDHVSL